MTQLPEPDLTATLFDDNVCQLGEGPLWHPERGEFFWFDILGATLFHRVGDETKTYQFDEIVSAAGWIDRDRLMIASATQLMEFNIETQESSFICGLESDNAATRSNDGRADPQGGFWIGTMGLKAEPEAGAIYRYYRGELRKLFPRVSIPNSICFAPSGDLAYYADTLKNKIMQVSLDADGWPVGKPSVFLDGIEGADGSVVDADGNLWNAQWGQWRVNCYSPKGEWLRAVAIGGAHSSCPAFGGPDLDRLYCTTAAVDVSAENLARGDGHGKVFALDGVAKGQAEHRVIL